MPSIEESKAEVKAASANTDTVDHDAILAGLQEEIDYHNARSDEEHELMSREPRNGHGRERSQTDLKFRFKHGQSDPRKRRHHRREHSDSRRRTGSKRARRESNGSRGDAPHPFPREPAIADHPEHATSNTAFQESLFDALADDEGAAYWENVYNQPIHIYARPTVQNPSGTQEEMNDEEYAAYVRTKMWEKTHPNEVRERERAARRRREEQEDRTRRREEFVRRKERAAWEKAQQDGARYHNRYDDDNHEYVFDFEGKTGSRSQREKLSTDNAVYASAWTAYLSAWDKLKRDLLAQQQKQSSDTEERAIKGLDPSKCIPWPVLPKKSVDKHNVEAFLAHMPSNDGDTGKHRDSIRMRQLKAERVRWHPDKIQQRFGGGVDEQTMKTVTEIFQVVDMLIEKERAVS